MSRLFEPTRINGMSLKNRFVRSATYEAMATVDGEVTDPLLDCMTTLVRGDVGLVITGHTYAARQGQAGPRQMGIYSDTLVHGLKQVASTIHENGGVVAVQLAHAGQRGIGKDTDSPLGPCDTFEKGVKKASAMAGDDIKKTVKAFGDAAERAGGDRHKASCISCNKCFTTFSMEEGLHCVAGKNKNLNYRGKN